MSFTFKMSGKEYTYSNVGERRGFVAELNKGNLSWKNLNHAKGQTNQELANKLKILCYQAIKNSSYVPYKTGNLKKNINCKSTSDGFVIYIDENLVPYQYFLEFGTRNSRKHVGFWYQNLANVVVQTILTNTKGSVTK